MSILNRIKNIFSSNIEHPSPINEELLECTNFSNDEIFKYLITPFTKYDHVDLRISNEDDQIISPDSDEKIMYICYDGEKEDLCIHLYKHLIGLFFLNEEIMFINDNIRGHICSCDTFANIVYDGELCSKSHAEVLTMIANLVQLLLDIKEVKILEKSVSTRYKAYKAYFYELQCKSKNGQKREYELENIKFIIE
jgi:hypothetical protein